MNNFRFILSGILGVLLSLLISWLICKIYPNNLVERDLENAKKLYGKKVSIANALSMFGFGSGMMLYFTGMLPKNDWRGLGIAMGLTTIMPLFYFIFILRIKNINSLVEIIDAFSVIHTTPRFLMY